MVRESDQSRDSFCPDQDNGSNDELVEKILAGSNDEFVEKYSLELMFELEDSFRFSIL